MPEGLTLGAPSHRCGKSLHRERCGTEPYLSGQLRSFKRDLDGKRGLLLAVVESDDPRDAMPSRTLPAQRTGFNSLDNWGHKTPTQSIKDKAQERTD